MYLPNEKIQKRFKMRYGITRSERELDALAEQVNRFSDGLSKPEYHGVLKRTACLSPWLPVGKGWAKLLDQFVHMFLGGALFLPLLLFPNIWGAFLAGLVIGIIRETEQIFNQDLHIPILKDRALEISIIGLGSKLLWSIREKY